MTVLCLILAILVWAIGSVAIGAAVDIRDWGMFALGAVLVFCGSFGLGVARAIDNESRCDGVMTRSVEINGVSIHAADSSKFCVVRP